MPVELNIIESVTELDTTVVTVVLESASEPGPAGPGVPTGGTAGQVLTKDSGTDYDTSWQDSAGGGGGAPDDVDYLVGTASGDLTGEIVVGTSPGGELGGTWASPTVDATHSGSSHASVQAAAEATAAAALSAHDADTTGIHGIADTSALALSAQVPSNATFNDHSARHENGGADEISIAGLDGTPTELTNHLNDTTAAHAASAISIADAGNDFTATDVEGALDELQADAESDAAALSAHIADSSAAHAASAISADSTTLVGTGTDVQAVLEELDNGIADHLADSSAAHAASAISFSPTGSVAATDVQAAIAEVASEATGIPATLFDAKGDLIAASAADTAARVAVGVDGAMLYADSSTTAGIRWMNDPVRQCFGAPDTAFEFNTSSLSGLTALGTPTTENADTTVAGALYLAQAAGTINIVGRYVAASTPFTAITYLKAFAGYTQFNAAGLIIGASTPGALATYGPRLTNIHVAGLSAVSWTGPTGTGTGIAAGLSPIGFVPVYLMMVANSSDDVDMYFSYNGHVWTRFSLNYNPSFTVGSIGLGIQAESASSTSVAAAFDYLRIWNSALTVPGSP